MRTDLLALRATGPAAVLVAASALVLTAAPTALSAEEHRGTVWATPSTASPGAQIELRVNGCDGTTGAAKSPVFVADAHLSGRDGGGNPLYGEAMIRSGAKPGWYSIQVTCDGRDAKATGSIQVVHHEPTHRPTHHPSPIWPVHAGGGGMAAELATGDKADALRQTAARDARDEGPGLPHTVIGAVLACAATLAVAGRAVRLRRRRSGE
ncbi:hypothetical protein [Streptomyces sp. NPDC097619]|uniref:hypothetical protein n=1 Tax=Streptomyces sp. NPDC097619 TaxID=3157228 RepID=UPI0033324E9A